MPKIAHRHRARGVCGGVRECPNFSGVVVVAVVSLIPSPSSIRCIDASRRVKFRVAATMGDADLTRECA